MWEEHFDEDFVQQDSLEEIERCLGCKFSDCRGDGCPHFGLSEAERETRRVRERNRYWQKKGYLV